jgi:hypothetical protein
MARKDVGRCEEVDLVEAELP